MKLALYIPGPCVVNSVQQQYEIFLLLVGQGFEYNNNKKKKLKKRISL